METPGNLLYTKEHEWVDIQGLKARIGITHYAQEQLGSITFVELPAAGKKVKQFGPLCSVESVKAATDVYSPVSGTVSAANKVLDASPEKVNASPYGDGWIAEIDMGDPAEKANLMDAAAYAKYVEGLGH